MLQMGLFIRQIVKASKLVSLGLFCGLLLLLASVAFNQSDVRAQTLGIVETDGELLNVREGPGSDYEILYQLDDQNYVQILGADSTGEWFEIRFDDESGRGGWIFASYVYQYPESALDTSEDSAEDSVEEVSEDTSEEISSDTSSEVTEDVVSAEAPVVAQEEIILTVTARAELAATEIAKILGTATASVLETAIAAADEVVLEATVTARAEIAATEIAKIHALATTAAAEADVATATPEPTSEPMPEPTEEPNIADQSDAEATAEAKNIRAATMVARAQIASTEIAKIHATATAMAVVEESEPVPTMTPEPIVVESEVVEVVAGEVVESETVAPEAVEAEAVEPETDAPVEDSENSEVAPANDVADIDTVEAETDASVEDGESGEEAPAEELATEAPTDDAPAQNESIGEPVPDESASDEPAADGVSAVTKVERMNIYSGPGTHYTLLATVTAGTDFNVTSLDGTGLWYQVEVEGMTELAWAYSGLVETRGDLGSLPQILETIPTRVPQVTPTPTQIAAADPDVLPTPTLRPMMEASDPATFEVASGQYQVVEFFGFW